jgi:hypothetical protein
MRIMLLPNFLLNFLLLKALLTFLNSEYILKGKRAPWSCAIPLNL